jgi:hypothetical protein
MGPPRGPLWALAALLTLQVGSRPRQPAAGHAPPPRARADRATRAALRCAAPPRLPLRRRQATPRHKTTCCAKVRGTCGSGPGRQSATHGARKRQCAPPRCAAPPAAPHAAHPCSPPPLHRQACAGWTCPRRRCPPSSAARRGTKSSAASAGSSCVCGACRRRAPRAQTPTPTASAARWTGARAAGPGRRRRPRLGHDSRAAGGEGGPRSRSSGV